MNIGRCLIGGTERSAQATDEEYFENMSRVIFQAGLNWQVIDNKWPSIKKAFSNFKIGKVACFTDADVERLMKDPEIIRNKGKIQGNHTKRSKLQSHRKTVRIIPKIP